MTIDALRESASRAGRARRTEVDPEVHRSKEAGRLRESCQQFESILWAQVWKKMRDGARAVSGSDRDRPWKQMEDLSLEMATDDLAASDNGPGLWRMLYDRMVGSLAARDKSVTAEGLSEEGPERVSARP